MERNAKTESPLEDLNYMVSQGRFELPAFPSGGPIFSFAVTRASQGLGNPCLD